MKKIYFLLIVSIFSSCSVEDDLYLESKNHQNLNAFIDEACSSFYAGTDNSKTITIEQADALASALDVKKLFLSLLEEGVSKEGIFSPSVNAIVMNYSENGIGTYTTVYTLTDGDCSDSVELTINIVESLSDCEIEAGTDASKIVTKSEVDALASALDVKKLYLSLLAQEVSRAGNFSPSINDIITDYHQNGIGSYTTTYTITDGDCSDSVELTLDIIADPLSEPTCDAGADALKTVTKSKVDALASALDVKKLYLSLLEQGVSGTGDFSPSINNIITNYHQNGIGSYTTTYTITDGDCSDSVELTLDVIADPLSEPVCDAGSNASAAVSRSEVDALASALDVKKLYLSLLEQGVSKAGSFNPSINNIIKDYHQNGLGTYTTTYTITDGDCSDSVELSIIVIAE